jgi:putative transposase
VRKSYQYKVKFKASQEQEALKQLELLRVLYNACLEHRRTLYDKHGLNVSVIDQKNELPEIKKLIPEYKQVGSQVLQDAVERVDHAFKHFFRRVKRGETPGYPRFKGRDYYKSLTFKQAGYQFKGKGRIQLQGISGHVKFFEPRSIQGDIKTVTLKRDSCGDWFLIFSCDNVPTEPLEKTGKEIGVDLGLMKFLTTSDNQQVPNPRFLQKNQKNLRIEQRKLAKKKQGSSNRKKQRLRVAKLHRKITRSRHDYHFKLAHYLVSHYDRIMVENLNVKNMIQTGSLNKSIHDAAWASFVEILLFKAEKAGKEVILVDPKNTSQVCSACGSLPKVKKTLRDRQHSCDCGAVLDRDHNAALNVLQKGGKRPLVEGQNNALLTQESPRF